MRGKLLSYLVAVVGVVVLWIGCSNDQPVIPQDTVQPVEGDEGARLFDWAMGPIEGITTVWHPTPEEFTVPVGTRLLLKCGTGVGHAVEWVNASEVRRVSGGSLAECLITEPGRHEIQAVLVSEDGNGDRGKGKGLASSSTPAHICVVRGVEASLTDIAVQRLSVAVKPLQLSQTPSNWETMRAFSENPAQLTRTGPAVYRTAVGRPVALRTDGVDPRFAGLIEVRVTGKRPYLATEPQESFDRPGRYTVSVGPPGRAKELVMETYSVSITKERDGPIIEDQPETFRAWTDPPGYEEEVTWLASTRDGSASPAIGHGSTFTVTIAKPWTPVPGTNVYSEWVGVRADNATLTQDPQEQKYCIYRVSGLVKIDGNNDGVNNACPAWAVLDARCKGNACASGSDCSNTFEHKYVDGVDRCCVLFSLVECNVTALAQDCPGALSCAP